MKHLPAWIFSAVSPLVHERLAAVGASSPSDSLRLTGGDDAMLFTLTLAMQNTVA